MLGSQPLGMVVLREVVEALVSRALLYGEGHWQCAWKVVPSPESFLPSVFPLCHEVNIVSHTLLP